MKTAAKIFTVIGIVVGFLTVIAPIVGFIALSKMKKATCKKDLTVIAILNLLFCNLLGGLFMLLIPETDFAQQ